MVVVELLFRGILYLTWSQARACLSACIFITALNVHICPMQNLSNCCMINICLRYCRYGVKHRSIDQSINQFPAVGNHGNELSGIINKYNLHRLVLKLPYTMAYHFQSNLKYLQGYRISQLIKQSPFLKL